MSDTLSPSEQAKALYRANLTAAITALRTRYDPRPTPWTGLPLVEQERVLNIWLDTCAASGVSIDDFGAAAMSWAEGEGGEYFPSIMDLLRIIARFHRPGALASRQERDASRAQCDGTGWKQSGSGLSPCPRCNRALTEVFRDPERLRMWLDGVGLDSLDVGVERSGPRMRYVGNPTPVLPCRSADDVIATAEQGRAALLAGYLAQCDDDGREPNMRYIEGYAETLVATRSPGTRLDSSSGPAPRRRDQDEPAETSYEPF